MNESEQLIHLHQTAVGAITAAEARRQNYSNTATGIISLGIALFGSQIAIDGLFLAFPIFIISITWFVTIRFFTKLSKQKWEVVTEIEEKLCYKPFTEEWEKLESKRAKWDIGPTTLEQIVPVLVCIATFIYIIFRIYSYY